jgi:hypothetical protein
VQQRRERPQRPPHARLAATEPRLEQVLDLGTGARSRRELQELGDERVGVGGGQPAGGEAPVVQAGGTQAGQHRVVERRVVLGVHGVHGVQGDAHQRRLDHRVVGNGFVHLRYRSGT